MAIVSADLPVIHPLFVQSRCVVRSLVAGLSSVVVQISRLFVLGLLSQVPLLQGFGLGLPCLGGLLCAKL